MKPEVSIIIPAYNAATFISETISSVLGQTFTNWELIIVDDGSTDNTLKLVEKYLSDERIILIKQENQGVSAARNKGLLNCKAPFVLFLDADDLLLPENFQVKLEIFSSKKNIALVHNWVEVIDEKGKKTGQIKKGKEGDVLVSLLEWEGDVIPAPSSALIKTDVAKELGGFDENLSTAADQDFFIRISMNHKVAMAKQVLSKYRILSGSMSKNISRMEKEHIAVFKKAEQSGLFHTKKFRKKCFANLYLILAGSWAKQGGNKARGIKFLWKAVALYPPIISKIVQKTK